MKKTGNKAKLRTLDEWLADIRRDAELIVNNTAGVTLIEFEENIVLSDHGMKRLANIGEAAKYIGRHFEVFQARESGVPWKDLAKTRDVISHAYFAMDPALIWNMAKRDMPDVLDNITKVIAGRDQARSAQAWLTRGPSR